MWPCELLPVSVGQGVSIPAGMKPWGTFTNDVDGKGVGAVVFGVTDNMLSGPYICRDQIIQNSDKGGDQGF